MFGMLLIGFMFSIFLKCFRTSPGPQVIWGHQKISIKPRGLQRSLSTLSCFQTLKSVVSWLARVALRLTSDVHKAF